MRFFNRKKKKEEKRLWPTLCEKIEEDLMELQSLLSQRAGFKSEVVHRLYDDIGACLELLQATCYQDSSWLKKVREFEEQYEAMGDKLYLLHAYREQIKDEMGMYDIQGEIKATWIREKCEWLRGFLKSEAHFFPERAAWRVSAAGESIRRQCNSFEEFIQAINEDKTVDAYHYMQEYITWPQMEKIEHLTKSEQHELLMMVNFLIVSLKSKHKGTGK
ncbi:hypothetical protein AM501_09870 [Aneurinibacillus migulanus]|nr:hypothetical protein TS64_09285 [Aneurinibacillus migulanus]KPD08460.1 hypothetical protein AM501_09870 [Aneurinibacillus migulanus]